MAYTELDTSQNLFRLVYLHPASSEHDTIQCRFVVALLDSKPEYKALSYVWGDVKDPRSIEVEGSVVSITSNLYSALRYLRLKNKDRRLWVDALCINQDDIKERNYQVSRMGSIYSQASQVVVWLGEGWDGSDMAIEFLRRLAGNEILHLDPLLEPNISVNGLSLSSVELCGHIAHLFALPWWNRTWTVQEFVLAQKLVYQFSNSSITGETMSMATANFWSHRTRCCAIRDSENISIELGMSVHNAFTQPARLDFITNARGPSYSILTAIVTFRGREVTDPRDKVYGLLGLGTGVYTDLVEPDYPLSQEEVCQAVVIKSAERTGTLEFLSHLLEPRNPKFPSYIPNWTAELSGGVILENRLHDIKLFNAALNTLADFKLIASREAKTSGTIFDVIITTNFRVLRSLEDYDAADFFYDIHRLARVDESSEEHYGNTGCSRRVALWHSLCGGVEAVFQDSNAYSRRLQGSTDLSNYFKWKELCTASPRRQSELWGNEISNICGIVDTATYDRRFFTTEKGYFGFGPPNCEVGDRVAILAGGKVPYIIRLASQASKTLGTSSYTMIGDSYVHGIMDGEAFEILDESERKFKQMVFI